MIRKLSYLLILLAFIGCGGNELTSEDVIGTSGHFHGAVMGDDLETTRQHLEPFLMNDNSVLTGILEKGPDRSVVYRLEFSNEELAAIQLDIFTKDEAEKLRLTDDIIHTLNKRFGQSLSRSGFYLWQDTFSPHRSVEYAFADESAEYGIPKLSLTIYTFDR